MCRAAAGALLLAGAGALPAVPDAPDAPDARHERGRAIYNFHCYFCHGYAGDAATLAASFLEPAPRDFRHSDPEALDRERMLDAVTHGRPGTAMQPFADRLDAQEIALVVDFVRREFMVEDRDNTRYHTAENGWPDHERYAAAFPFATGERPLDTPWEALDARAAAGKRLFLESCVSCHDRAVSASDAPVWEPRPLSYPRGGYSHRPAERIDAASGATPYRRHDAAPSLDTDDPQLRAGEALFQDNCAFCHAADGTGRNWIGSFLEPHPRDLTDPDAMRGMTPARLRRVIRDGLPGTSMPAWGDVLDDAQVDAVVRYVDAVFHPLAANGEETDDDRAAR